MKTPFVTDAQRAQLLANGRARAAGQAFDPLPVVRLFTPDAHPERPIFRRQRRSVGGGVHGDVRRLHLSRRHAGAHRRRGAGAFSLLLGLGMAASVPLAGSLALLGLALAVWGIAYTALFPICQVRVMKSATHAQALAGTLHVSAANAGTGLGAIIGRAGDPPMGIGKHRLRCHGHRGRGDPHGGLGRALAAAMIGVGRSRWNCAIFVVSSP